MDKTVTALQAQKNHRERINVWIDGEFAFGLSRIVAAWLSVGSKLSEEKIDHLINEDAIESSYQKTLHFLSFRFRSEWEIKEYLKKQNISDAVRDLILSRLREKDFVNDSRFAKEWVENRSHAHPSGKRALVFELRQKHIPEEMIKDALEEIDEERLASLAFQKAYPRLKELEWLNFRQKGFGYLARRGFGYEVSAVVIRRMWDEQHLQDQIKNKR